MNFGFVIDNRACIGCHACSTVCKSENDVPLGVYRTWVKYTETGTFPDNRRHFQVTRCNHCSNPPCVRICPVTAMYQREDGIVDFDSSRCIGCKACLQACPYDAIHIDPETNTAAKCHYCAHRTDIGLEPACVVVCPEHAIIAGDLDDPSSEIAKVVAKEKVTVRKPEQGTAPKLFYIEGNDVMMHPTATERSPETFLWADVVSPHGKTAAHGQPPTSSQGLPAGGPIHIGGRISEHMVQVSYNAQHKIPWHWPVPAYLVTKGIAAGIVMLVALALALGVQLTSSFGVFASSATLFFTALTTALLVLDLEKPGRFLRIVLTPQWNSWLTRGAFILIAFSLVAGVWWVLEVGAAVGQIDPGYVGSARPWIIGIAAPLGAGVAAYTAFLFGQAEGRDLWQSPLLPVHLLVQAAMVGSAFVVLASPVLDMSQEFVSLARTVFVASLIVDLVVTLLGEIGMPHASEVAARAAHDITHGRYKHYFWTGSVVLGHVVPLVLIPLGLPIIAGALVVVGLYLYEHAFVMAPQDVPNS